MEPDSPGSYLGVGVVPMNDNESEAPVYRVNRAMRGAAVGAGRHRLVYTYRPRSFLAGAGLSAAGLAALTALGLAVRSGR